MVLAPEGRWNASPPTFLRPLRKVGPEHFGIVSVDCAKARSKWMLADFFGNVLVLPTVVKHNRLVFDDALQQLRQAVAQHDLRDLLVAFERTGRYHHAPKCAFAAAGFEVRIVHPFATKQLRQPSDPGYKTEDTDLTAILRAAVARRVADPLGWVSYWTCALHEIEKMAFYRACIALHGKEGEGVRFTPSCPPPDLTPAHARPIVNRRRTPPALEVSCIAVCLSPINRLQGETRAMKQLLGWIVFIAVAGYLVFATGFHKDVITLVTGRPAENVSPTSYGVMVR